jgi:hypothetical protein
MGRAASAELRELASRVERATGPDRELDADIAIALFGGNRSHPDPREHEHARRVLISHGAQPGNYEVVAFSGISLRTALEYTKFRLSRLDTAASLRARAGGE